MVLYKRPFVCPFRFVFITILGETNLLGSSIAVAEPGADIPVAGDVGQGDRHVDPAELKPLEKGRFLRERQDEPAHT